MSHILHFYHLVALDYVKPVAWNVPNTPPNTFTDLTRPFLAPRYDDNYYINNARVLMAATLLGYPGVIHPAVGAIVGLPGANVNFPNNLGDAVNNYLVGQYLKALNIRRICHEMQAIFAGRAPICSGFTPGGVTATVDSASVASYQAKLTQVLAFIGSPSDFATGTTGTMMFDVVAAAHLFPEYFWIGNAYGHFLAYGIFETGFVDGVSDFAAHVLGTHAHAPDNRGFTRGYRLSAQMPFDGSGNFIPPNYPDPQFHLRIVESIASSRYNKAGVNYPDGKAFKHPWIGLTQPVPDNEYSWLKSPRLDINPVPDPVNGTGNYQPFEVGPLARQVVQGNYFAGILNALGYTVTPVLGQLGPDCATGADALGAFLKPIYAAIPPAGRLGGPNLSGVAYNGDSVLDRIAARAVETLLMGLQCQNYINALSGTISGGYGPSGCTDPKVPVLSKIYRGYGMTEASRGALSHWITMKSGRIKAYQAVVPTTWNASPRDALNNPGPAEKSLMSNGGLWVASPSEPIEVIRVTHSYDFCIACAVHLITPKGDVHKADVPALP